MIGHCERSSGAVRIVTDHRDVLSFANDNEAKTLQRLNDLFLWGINRKL